MKPLRDLALLALLTGPVAAEPAGCDLLVSTLTALTGYRVNAPVAAPETGWCVLDRAVLKAKAGPDLAAERLRLRGEADDGVLVELAVEAGGLRLAPGLGQRDVDATLRETLRFQTAELVFRLTAGPQGLALRDGVLRLSGGSEVTVLADLAGAGWSSGSVVLGRLTRLEFGWRNDGKLLRPVMAAWGEGLVDGARGATAIDASRLALRHIAENLPVSLIPEASLARLERLIGDLPQSPGRLSLRFASPAGIGAAQLGVAVLSGDPLGPEALARLFAGAVLEVDWQPGLAE